MKANEKKRIENTEEMYNALKNMDEASMFRMGVETTLLSLGICFEIKPNGDLKIYGGIDSI